MTNITSANINTDSISVPIAKPADDAESMQRSQLPDGTQFHVTALAEVLEMHEMNQQEMTAVPPLHENTIIKVGSATDKEIFEKIGSEPIVYTPPQFTKNKPASQSRLDNFFKKTDLRAAVTQAQNEEFLQRLGKKPSQDTSGEQAITITSLKNNMEELQRVLNSAGESVPGIALKKSHKAIANILKHLKNLENGQPPKKRILLALSTSIFYPLPLMVAYYNNDKQYMAILSAAYARSMASLYGYVHHPKSDTALILDHIKDRHAPYLFPAIPYLLPTFWDKAKFLEDEIPFHLGAAAFAGFGLFATFHPHQIESACNAIRNFVVGGSNRKMDLTPARIKELKAQLEILKNDKSALKEFREAFEGSGREISDNLSKQVGHISSSLTILEAELDKLLETEADTLENKDLLKKLAFAFCAGAVCCTATVMTIPGFVAMIDMGVDTAIVACIMVGIALNASMTAQDGASNFSNFAGLSMVTLPFMIANKITPFFSESTAGTIGGAIGLTAANLTLPGPVSDAVSRGLVHLFGAIQSTYESSRPSKASAEVRIKEEEVGITESTPSAALTENHVPTEQEPIIDTEPKGPSTDIERSSADHAIDIDGTREDISDDDSVAQPATIKAE